MLQGSMQRVTKEEPLLFSTYPVVQKKGFSDVIMPGDMRNDLYLTLQRGEFEKAGRNVQAQVSVVDGQTGALIEVNSRHMRFQS
jgi:dedicator of cytokinesis protein 3